MSPWGFSLVLNTLTIKCDTEEFVVVVILLVHGNECPHNRDVTKSKNKGYPKNQNEIYKTLHLTTLKNSENTITDVLQYPIVQLDIF